MEEEKKEDEGEEEEEREKKEGGKKEGINLLTSVYSHKLQGCHWIFSYSFL